MVRSVGRARCSFSAGVCCVGCCECSLLCWPLRGKVVLREAAAGDAVASVEDETGDAALVGGTGCSEPGVDIRAVSVGSAAAAAEDVLGKAQFMVGMAPAVASELAVDAAGCTWLLTWSRACSAAISSRTLVCGAVEPTTSPAATAPSRCRSSISWLRASRRAW